MKIALLAEQTPNVGFIKKLRDSIGQYYVAKSNDPNYPEITNNPIMWPDLHYRSGNQDTPLKPRHRKYFNAPLGATQGKIGFGEPLGSWPYRPKLKT